MKGFIWDAITVLSILLLLVWFCTRETVREIVITVCLVIIALIFAEVIVFVYQSIFPFTV